MHNNKYKMQNSDKKQTKYGKKTSFSREKHHVYSEADIDRIDNKMNQLTEKRKEERNHNLKIASNEQVEEKTISKIKNPKTNGYADDIIDYEDPELLEYCTKMVLVMHDVPLSFNIDNVLRTFQYYGDIAYVHSTSSNGGETYSITAVPNEWNENIKDIQADIVNKGFAIIDKYRVTN